MSKLPPILCAVCHTRIWRGASGDWLHSKTGAYDHHATPIKPAPSIAEQEKRDAEQRAEYSGCAICNAVWHPDSYHDHTGPDHDANCFCMDRDEHVG